MCVQFCPKLVVSNVALHIFCLIMSLGSGQSIVPPSYVGLLVSSHTLLPPLTTLTPLSPATPSLSSNRHTHSDCLHPLLPMSALRAIIIMPCINNASQYINNASLQHGGGGLKEGEVMEVGGADGLFLAQHIMS